MGLQSALTTALTGLQAAETTIDVVGNNVANSQTVGFKESEAIFATQFLQTISIGAAPSTNNGGTNPRQIGLGVKVSEISPNFSQGTIEISSNPLDVAIQGDGFLIVQADAGQLYTRNGQLKLNSENEVVTATGQRVLGFTVNDDFEIIENKEQLVPLTIPLGKERVSQATANATFSGVLNPSVDLGATPSISESIVLGDGTIPQPSAVSGQDFDIVDFPEADPLSLSGISDAAGAVGTGPNAGTVTYKFVYLDGVAGHETAPSAEYTLTAPGGQEIDFSGLPIGSAPWDQGVAIYRQEDGGTDYYQVGSVGAGVTTFSDDVAEATLPTGTLLNEDLIPDGSYSYYVTYVDTDAGGEETRPTARIGTRTLAPPGGRIRVDLSDLDIPAGFDEVRIYRNTSTDSTSFYRVASVPVATTSFVDDVDDTTLSASEEINLDGPAALDDTLLTDLVVRSGDTYVEDFFELGTLSFEAEKDGVSLSPKELEITATSTVLDLMNFMRDALGIDSNLNNPSPDLPAAGSISLDGGKIIVTSNLGEENAIEIPLTAFQFTPDGASAAETLPISFVETQLADGPGTSTEMVVYDSLGLPLNVRITTVLEQKNPSSTVYRWYATSADNEPLAPSQTTVTGNGLLEFDSNGDLIPGATPQIAVERNITASESPLVVNLDFSQIKSLGETDAQGNPISTLNLSSQDGFPPGVLTDFIITEDGTIQGQFSNGVQRTLGQLVMARFANNGGLQQVGDSLFNIGVNSGEAIKGVPGSDGIGRLTSGAVELSNTDIGQNLIELILASTQYRGGARVITATQELLDELLALSR